MSTNTGGEVGYEMMTKAGWSGILCYTKLLYYIVIHRYYLLYSKVKQHRIYYFLVYYPRTKEEGAEYMT